LDGMRVGFASCKANDYGMNSYGNDSLNKLFSGIEICDKAKKLGFDHVIEVREDYKRLHNCP